nr:toll/interleukin-1 receptor domain-containing protein [uncultured Flavobacterium sp.]
MIKVFISYCHKDEILISKFISHLSPLKNNGIIKEWVDRKIKTGEEFQENIDNALDNAEIICLMISDNFLASTACIKEKNDSLLLKHKKGIRVIPIILSPCAWTEHNELSELLAIPTDGKPITKFEDQNEGWLDAIKWIKPVCQSINQIKQIKQNGSFNDFLNSADILSKSHYNKETVELRDIYVFPKLKQYDGVEIAQKYDSENFVTDILNFNKIIIAGENQAGKTTICKVIYKIYLNLNYLPIYIEDDNLFLGNPLAKLEKSFQEQYENIEFKDVEQNRIIPIVDNFHYAKHQEKYIESFKDFKYQLFIVDDIFGLNIKNQNLIKDYTKFKIREFSAIERNKLIKKWIQVKENDFIEINPNHLNQSLDEKTEMIENSLGLIFGKGIMPSYPFFILSLLAAQDIQKPLDQEITSQGHCYQALIYLYLRKEGVNNNQIDIYSNFLTELAFYIYTNGNNGLSNNKFQEFIENYKSHFNLPLPLTDILKVLSKVNICRFDSFNQFNFCYTYIYYFFIAKYISDNIDKNKKLVSKIISNIHKDENAYITIFIAHHSKSNYLLDELLLSAEMLFENYAPATLETDELSFFDKHEEKIIKAILPSYEHNTDVERESILNNKSENEENEKQNENINNDDDSDDFVTKLRFSIKTVEVMGMIIKNRSGSLPLERLEYIYEQGLKVHLRILTSFFELIKNKQTEIEFTDFIKERLNQINEERIEKEEKELNITKIEQFAREIFWNINFGVVHGFITKAIHSLGSNNLLKIAENVSNKEKTPSAFIVNQGINMWYAKSLHLDEIQKRISEKNFSKTAEKVIKFKIVEHSRLHKIDFKKLKEIEDKLKMSTNKLLSDRAKNK